MHRRGVFTKVPADVEQMRIHRAAPRTSVCAALCQQAPEHGQGGERQHHHDAKSEIRNEIPHCATASELRQPIGRSANRASSNTPTAANRTARRSADIAGCVLCRFERVDFAIDLGQFRGVTGAIEMTASFVSHFRQQARIQIRRRVDDLAAEKPLTRIASAPCQLYKIFTCSAVANSTALRGSRSPASLTPSVSRIRTRCSCGRSCTAFHRQADRIANRGFAPGQTDRRVIQLLDTVSRSNVSGVSK